MPKNEKEMRALASGRSMQMQIMQSAGKYITNPDEKLPARLERLPKHLRAAAKRSWQSREEDYRYLAEH